jgi:hypothetical protein
VVVNKSLASRSFFAVSLFVGSTFPGVIVGDDVGFNSVHGVIGLLLFAPVD